MSRIQLSKEVRAFIFKNSEDDEDWVHVHTWVDRANNPIEWSLEVSNPQRGTIVSPKGRYGDLVIAGDYAIQLGNPRTSGMMGFQPFKFQYLRERVFDEEQDKWVLIEPAIVVADLPADTSSVVSFGKNSDEDPVE